MLKKLNFYKINIIVQCSHTIWRFWNYWTFWKVWHHFHWKAVWSQLWAEHCQERCLIWIWNWQRQCGNHETWNSIENRQVSMIKLSLSFFLPLFNYIFTLSFFNYPFSSLLSNLFSFLLTISSYLNRARWQIGRVVIN